MGDNGEPRIPRAALLAGLAAALVGCTGDRRGADPATSSGSAAPTPTGSPTRTRAGSARPTPVRTAKSTVTPEATPGSRTAGTPSASPAAGSPSAAPSSDATAVLRRAIAREQELLAAYDAAIAGSPGLAEPLGVLRSHHEEHVERLAELLGRPAPRSTHPPRKRLPGATRSAAALRSLTAAEQAAAAAGVAAVGSVPGPAAVLLGEIAGSEAQHAVVLPRLAGGGR